MIQSTGLPVFSDQVVDQIIDEAIELLSNPGVRVHNQEGLSILASAGAKIDFTNQVVSIPREIIAQSLKTVPQEFHLFGLDGISRVHYGGDDFHFDPGSTAIAFLDNPFGVQRQPVTADYVLFTKIVETLPQIDAQSTAMVCTDIPEEIGDLYRLFLSLSLMKKPIVTGAFRKDTWWIMKELLVAAVGSEQLLKEKPVAIFDICPSPPLLWSDLTCQNLIDCARSGIPAELVSMPLAGAAGPVTLAGSIVQHTAECLSGVVIHQLASPGAPIVWGGSPAAFDMRQGTTPMGAAETWLIDAGYVQVGKTLMLPTHVYMGMSDAKLIDAQCGMESMGGTMLAAMSGANMISGAGMLDYETCQSVEKLIIDAEMIALTRRFMRGIEVREDPIAIDVIRQVGHHGDYLSHPHTHKWFRKELSFPSEVIDRFSYDTWTQSGSKSAFDRARDKAVDLIKAYPGSSLSQEVKRELLKITTQAAQQYGMDKLPEFAE
jgi:trimethylamine--corrinoid protein Co-methyltransferase